MSELSLAVRRLDDGIELKLLATPRASKNRIIGMHDGRLKIQLKAPPVDGAANAELIKFLARTLRLSKGSITLTAGQSSRRKSLMIRGDADAIFNELALHL